MSEPRQLNILQRLLKHSLLWVVFAYCYHSAINLLVKMAIDAQPDAVLVTSLLYCLGFNVLTAHLITKYDKYWPVIGACVIGVVGLILVPIIFVGAHALLSRELLAGILISLPIFTLIMGIVKQKLHKN
ncbi:hypothetical protein [Pseudoalteromonas sp. ZZD1]|uniref:hypothetical protein n=1 Tax=Pseudoalteromonas sp. ZZD1 TaxID=3139395 RepID=UPI003BAB2187